MTIQDLTSIPKQPNAPQPSLKRGTKIHDEIIKYYKLEDKIHNAITIGEE